MDETRWETGVQGTVHPSGLEIVTVPSYDMEERTHRNKEEETGRKKLSEKLATAETKMKQNEIVKDIGDMKQTSKA